MIVTKQKEPKMLRKLSWLLFKFIDKAEKKGSEFILSYELIAKDMSERLKYNISPETIRRYCRNLKELNLISISQYFRKRLKFIIIDLDGLIRKRTEIENLISNIKPKKYVNSGARVDISSARVKNSGARPEILVPDSNLNSSLKSLLKSSLKSQDDFSVDKPREEDPFYKAAYDATCNKFGRKIDETIKFIRDKLIEVSRKSVISNMEAYANKIAQDLKDRGHGYGNPYEPVKSVEKPKQKSKLDLELEAYIAEHGPIKVQGGYPGKEFLMRQLR